MTIPQRPQKFYNFANQKIIVGGYNITGFDDDGSVEYSFEADRYTHSVGADGQVTLSKVNDPRVIATITLKETGKGYQRLAQLHAQQGQGPVPSPITYVHKDPLVGDRVNSGQATFLTYPDIEKAKEAGSREFELLLPNAAENIVLASQNPEATA